MKRTNKNPIGRPKIPDKKMTVSIRLPPQIVRYIQSHEKPAIVVQSAIESSSDYKNWSGAAS